MYQIENIKNTILCGDSLVELKKIPNESIDAIITSPPYYGLRDYGTALWEGGDEKCRHFVVALSSGMPYKDICGKCGAKRIDQQLGLEKTFEEYLNKMLLITAELKRVLKKTGTLWWNHGDSYNGTKVGNTTNGVYADHEDNGKVYAKTDSFKKQKQKQIPEKCLMLQAHRLAIRMIDEQDWILRNTIIWHKPNAMPSSVKDRFTVDYEPIFFFSKSKKYWFEPQYEDYAPASDVRYRQALRAGRSYNIKEPYKNNTPYSHYKRGQGSVASRGNDADGLVVGGTNPLGRNKRSVWKIPTKPFLEAHFATFPPALIETPIKAGCPEFICKKCGMAREKIFKTEYHKSEGIWGKQTRIKEKTEGENVRYTENLSTTHKVLGYTGCNCNAGWTPGIVLDPFMGSGTTAVVAESLNRNWLGIELNLNYIKMAEKRIAAVPKSLFSL